jgi:hypothetical protein
VHRLTIPVETPFRRAFLHHRVMSFCTIRRHAQSVCKALGAEGQSSNRRVPTLNCAPNATTEQGTVTATKANFYLTYEEACLLYQTPFKAFCDGSRHNLGFRK